MNELNAAFLNEQLCQSEDILKLRINLSSLYYAELKQLEESNKLRLIPEILVSTNIHEFYIILNSKKEREELIILFE